MDSIVLPAADENVESVEENVSGGVIKEEEEANNNAAEDGQREVFYFSTGEFQFDPAIGRYEDVMESDSNNGYALPFTEDQLNQLLINGGGDSDKLSIDLSQMLKWNGIIADVKGESSGATAHYVKYKPDKNGKKVKIWECGICRKEFGHQYILMRHLPTHTDERKFSCKQCGKAFRQMSTLSQHKAIHSKLRPYVCEECHKTFNRVSTLISHRKTHTGNKPHQCHLCNKAFHQKGNLRNHIFTHTNERPYKCDVCQKGFNQMSNLMCHKFKSHQRADKPKYNCQVCGKEFDKRIALRNHDQYVHGEQSAATASNATLVTSSGSAAISGAAAANNGTSAFVSTARALMPFSGPCKRKTVGAIDSAVSNAKRKALAVPSVKYTNGVLIPPIETNAMREATAINQVPFALLRPKTGIPVLVQVLPAGDKQMLVPATVEDLRKHGHVTVKEPGNASAEQQSSDVNDGNVAGVANNNNNNVKDNDKNVTVQIRVPIVANVVQREGCDGAIYMSVEEAGPLPEDQLADDNRNDEEDAEDVIDGHNAEEDCIINDEPKGDSADVAETSTADMQQTLEKFEENKENVDPLNGNISEKLPEDSVSKNDEENSKKLAVLEPSTVATAQQN